MSFSISALDRILGWKQKNEKIFHRKKTSKKKLQSEMGRSKLDSRTEGETNGRSAGYVPRTQDRPGRTEHPNRGGVYEEEAVGAPAQVRGACRVARGRYCWCRRQVRPDQPCTGLRF